MIAEALTEREELEAMLPSFNERNIKDLLKYAKYLRWSDVEDDDDGSWADLPLTPDEEEGLRRGREDARNGKMLTLEEFLEGL